MYLLDTHTLLWFVADADKLSSNARSIIENKNNSIYLSAASVWEISIKSAIGKITLKKDMDKFIADIISEYDFEPLPITIPHTVAVHSLPDFHKDPFDRLLVAQAMIEKLTIITADEYIGQYDIPRIW